MPLFLFTFINYFLFDKSNMHLVVLVWESSTTTMCHFRAIRLSARSDRDSGKSSAHRSPLGLTVSQRILAPTLDQAGIRDPAKCRRGACSRAVAARSAITERRGGRGRTRIARAPAVLPLKLATCKPHRARARHIPRCSRRALRRDVTKDSFRCRKR